MPLWVQPRRRGWRAGDIAAMGKRIAIILGHPDATEPHYCHSLARAYLDGATKAGHEVRVIDVARLDFPLLRNRREFESAEPPAVIRAAQDDIRWAQHLVIVYPLWLGTLPALLKAFFEQTFRYGFALSLGSARGMPKKLLAGRSARIVVTMGMPATAYKYLFRAHGLKSLESGILSLSGIRPIRSTLIGLVENRSAAWRRRVLDEMCELGARAH
jgi:putative NADPH-quinone reductase